MNLIVIGTYIVAASDTPFVESDDALVADGIVYQKDVIAGYQVVQADIPEGRTASECEFVGGQVVAKAADVATDKVDMWEKIKDERERRILAGGYLVSGHWYHSDLISRSQQLGLARKADIVKAAGGDMTAPFTLGGQTVVWKTMDNGFVPMTPNLALTILAAAELQDALHFIAANTHKTAMEASSNPAAYDYLSAGWPAIYA